MAIASLVFLGWATLQPSVRANNALGAKLFETCSVNADCTLPKICCHGVLVDFCCNNHGVTERINGRRRFPNITIPTIPPLHIPPLPGHVPRPVPIPIPLPRHMPVLPPPVPKYLI